MGRRNRKQSPPASEAPGVGDVERPAGDGNGVGAAVSGSGQGGSSSGAANAAAAVAGGTGQGPEEEEKAERAKDCPRGERGPCLLPVF